MYLNVVLSVPEKPLDAKWKAFRDACYVFRVKPCSALIGYWILVIQYWKLSF
jgi:hypothetical protein